MTSSGPFQLYLLCDSASGFPGKQSSLLNLFVVNYCNVCLKMTVMFLDLAVYPESSASLMDPYKPGTASPSQPLSSKTTAPGNFEVFPTL